jgi:hypothetical protein
MNKKPFYLAAAVVASLCGSAYAAPKTTSQAQTNQPAAQPPSQSPQTQMIQPNSPQTPPDCTKLTPDQMTFAGQFTDMNLRAAFCSQLTSDQRQQVMAMTYQPDSNGNLLTADQAMKNFMQANNMLVPGASPATTTPRRPGGGCPVK